MEKKEKEITPKGYQTMIIPYALPKSDAGDVEIGIEKMSITYCQEDDTNHRTEDGDDQRITIETEDAIVSREDAINGNGYYFVMKTDRWAFESADEIAFIINDFKSRLKPNFGDNDPVNNNVVNKQGD